MGAKRILALGSVAALCVGAATPLFMASAAGATDATTVCVRASTENPLGNAVIYGVNLTVTQPQAQGDLRLYPGGSTLPDTSTMNYRSGQTRANNAVVNLGTGSDLVVRCVQGSGTVHFILDVTGYFE